MARRLPWMIVTAILFGVLSGTPALADHSWNGYRWSGDGRPLRITYVDSLTRGFRRQHVAGAVLDDWETDDVVGLDRDRSENSRSIRKKCPPVTGAIRICNADYGEGWFGQTELLVEGVTVTGGRIRINDYWGTGASFRRFVLCHEVGHSLGLWHRTDGSSCLNGGRHPDKHDLAMVRELLTTASGQEVENAQPPECADGVLCVVNALAEHNGHTDDNEHAHSQSLTPLSWHLLLPF
ncbi:MAG: hypothetical protein ACRDJV_09110 [Actinomycetota bacterium]